MFSYGIQHTAKFVLKCPINDWQFPYLYAKTCCSFYKVLPIQTTVLRIKYYPLRRAWSKAYPSSRQTKTSICLSIPNDLKSVFAVVSPSFLHKVWLQWRLSPGAAASHEKTMNGAATVQLSCKCGEHPTERHFMTHHAFHTLVRPIVRIRNNVPRRDLVCLHKWD